MEITSKIWLLQKVFGPQLLLFSMRKACSAGNMEGIAQSFKKKLPLPLLIFTS